MKDNKFLNRHSLFLTVFFLFPILFLFTKINLNSNISFVEVINAVKVSLIQGGIASVICVFSGFFSALALCSLPQKLENYFKSALLLPQILPVFFTVLIVFSFFNPFPMGTIGVIILFCIVNFGIVSVVLAEAIQSKIGRTAAISEIFGISRFVYYTRVLLPIIRADLFRCFYLVLVFCVSSFSIPLLAGGGKSINLEILIYEKIYVHTDWGAAVYLAVLQTVFIYLMALPLSQNTQQANNNFQKSKILNSKSGLILICLYPGFYISGYVAGIVKSLGYLDFLSRYSDELISATFGSLSLAVMTSAVSFILIFLILHHFVRNEKIHFTMNFLSPSTAVVGFSFYLMFAATRSSDSYKFVFAFLILSFPALFKLFIQSKLLQLQRQIQVALVLGISRSEIVYKILFSQLKRPIAILLSIQTFWILGDYSVSRAVGLQTRTLGLMSESFLSGYRLPAAFLMSGYIVLLWSLTVAIIFYLLKDNRVDNT